MSFDRPSRTTNGGSIPPNLIECGNNESNSDYVNHMRTSGRKLHPARFPSELPRFFIKFCTDKGDTVIDPFAGSNTTGMVAESLGRKWIAVEKDEQYWEDSQLRFSPLEMAAAAPSSDGVVANPVNGSLSKG